MRFAVKIDDAKTCASIRKVVEQWLHNSFPYLSLPDEITDINMQRHHDHISLDWSGNIEADIPGPNPDLLRVRAYAKHAEIDARFSGLRINYE